MPAPADLLGQVDELLARIAKGDRAAEEELFRIARRMLEGLAKRELGPATSRWAEVDDLVQTICTEALVALRSGRAFDGQAFWNLLSYRVPWRSTDIARSSRRLEGQSHVAPGDVPMATTLSGHLNRRENARNLRDRIARLAEPDATIVRRVGLDQASYAEVANELPGLSPEAVRKRYERSLERLGLSR